jgi:hypothetical protein
VIDIETALLQQLLNIAQRESSEGKCSSAPEVWEPSIKGAYFGETWRSPLFAPAFAPPNTIAPSRPLPIGSASSQTGAGDRYQSTSRGLAFCARATKPMSPAEIEKPAIANSFVI